MPSNAKKPASMHVALAAIVPLIVGVFATELTALFSERYGTDAVPVVLVGWCALLFVSAVWLNRILLHDLKPFLPSLAAVVIILLVWLWQRIAFTRVVPRSGFTYGYFLTPNGVAARMWVLTYPFWVGLACLSICFVTALILAWRTAKHYSLAVIPWWLMAFLIFALPSMYLDAQGNASIFI